MEETLRSQIEALGPDHFEVAATLANLGLAHGKLGDAAKS